MTLARPSKFAHVVYRTRRFAEMLEWYKTVFGAEIHHQNPAMAFLSYDDEHHRFAMIDLNTVDPEGSEIDKHGLVGVDHVAYTYESMDGLLDIYKHLKEHGITPYWCVHHGITASMYYQDPDGNQMEFQVDCFESSDSAVAFMNGGGFEANPVGVEYDPDAWLAGREAGTPLSELMATAAEGPVSPIRGALESVNG